MGIPSAWMDGRTGEWIEGWMGGCMDRKVGAWVSRWMSRRAHGFLGEWMNGVILSQYTKMMLQTHCHGLGVLHTPLNGGYFLATNEKHVWNCLSLFRAYLESGHKPERLKLSSLAQH